MSISGRGLTRKQKQGHRHAERETRNYLNRRYMNLGVHCIMNTQYLASNKQWDIE